MASKIWETISIESEYMSFNQFIKEYKLLALVFFINTFVHFIVFLNNALW